MKLFRNIYCQKTIMKIYNFATFIEQYIVIVKTSKTSQNLKINPLSFKTILNRFVVMFHLCMTINFTNVTKKH